MARMPDAEITDLAATVAVTRLLLGPSMRIQAAPNLIGEEYGLMLAAGIDDWGGVSPLTPDHVNPERPWPHIDELAAQSAEAGFRLVERLTIYPPYVRAGEPWLDPRILPHVSALADPMTGLAPGACPPSCRHGCRWSLMKTESKPDSSASTAYRSSSVGPNCSFEAFVTQLEHGVSFSALQGRWISHSNSPWIVLQTGISYHRDDVRTRTTRPRAGGARLREPSFGEDESMQEAVLVEVLADGVATITLNRPDFGNAIDLEMADDIYSAVNRLKNDPNVRVVCLKGSGNNFCVGGDVTKMAAASERGAFLAALAGRLHEALRVLRVLPVPVIASVQGAAAGAGLGLVLACDLVIADTSAKFLTAYAGVGLTPDCGVSALLPTVVGVRRASLLALTGRVLSADEALEWGLISEVCTAGELDARVAQLSAKLAAGPSAAFGAAANLMRAASSGTYDDHLDEELTKMSRIGETTDTARRIEQFVARASRKERSA
jgi:2-(1,2-epoxy-1,2-dihydrophenyl)acetyl-CoA isomerase